MCFQWSCGGLNPGHFACEANTLPLSYSPTHNTMGVQLLKNMTAVICILCWLQHYWNKRNKNLTLQESVICWLILRKIYPLLYWVSYKSRGNNQILLLLLFVWVIKTWSEYTEFQSKRKVPSTITSFTCDKDKVCCC